MSSATTSATQAERRCTLRRRRRAVERRGVRRGGGGKSSSIKKMSDERLGGTANNIGVAAVATSGLGKLEARGASIESSPHARSEITLSGLALAVTFSCGGATNLDEPRWPQADLRKGQSRLEPRSSSPLADPRTASLARKKWPPPPRTSTSATSTSAASTPVPPARPSPTTRKRSGSTSARCSRASRSPPNPCQIAAP